MAKAYWLVKSEPSVYSWSQLVAEKRTAWTGVRNFAARLNLRAMKVGDLALYYHSGEGKEIVGIAEIVRAAYADETAPGEDWSAVDVAAERPLEAPVTLAAIKANPKLAQMQLVKQSRLSVCAVTKAEFDEIVRLGAGAKKPAAVKKAAAKATTKKRAAR
jgi:predicted RNA-binding protein with PUA-like domain